MAKQRTTNPMTITYGPPKAYGTVLHPDDTVYYWSHNYTHVRELTREEFNNMSTPTNKETPVTTTPINTIGAQIVAHDLRVLRHKNATYGDSWKKRGGMDTFMMLARKWDRIENMVSQIHHKEEIIERHCKPGKVVQVPTNQDTQFNILERGYLPTPYLPSPGTTHGDDGYTGDPPDDSLLAQVRDLRRYLLLVDIELTQRAKDHQRSLQAPPTDTEELTVVDKIRAAVEAMPDEDPWQPETVEDPLYSKKEVDQAIQEAHRISQEQAANRAYRATATKAMDTATEAEEIADSLSNPPPKDIHEVVDGLLDTPNSPQEDQGGPNCPDCGATHGTHHEFNCPMIQVTYYAPKGYLYIRCQGCKASDGESHAPNCPNLTPPPLVGSTQTEKPPARMLADGKARCIVCSRVPSECICDLDPQPGVVHPTPLGSGYPQFNDE